MKRPCRSLKSWSKLYFSEDLFPQVLSRLPSKSLVRFRCVSKPWRALIDDPEFARLHLINFNNNRSESRLSVVHGKHPLEQHCVVRCAKTLHFPTKLGLPNLDEAASLLWEVLYSIDGLFLLRSSQNPEFMLWNPSISKTLILPPAPQFSDEFFYLEFGMGFDPLTMDYKYVRVVANMQLHGCVCFAVYTLGSDSWKIVEFRGCSCWPKFIQLDNECKTICYRGVIYSLARNHFSAPKRLVSFDLSSEMFDSASLPVEYDIMSSQSLTMMGDGCSIGVVHLTRTQGSIWVSRHLGDDTDQPLTWTKRYSFAMTIPIEDILYGFSKFLFLKKNGEMLMKRGSSITSYNFETQKENVLLKRYVHNTWAYMESLINSAHQHTLGLFQPTYFCRST